MNRLKVFTYIMLIAGIMLTLLGLPSTFNLVSNSEIRDFSVIESMIQGISFPTIGISIIVFSFIINELIKRVNEELKDIKTELHYMRKEIEKKR